MALTYGITHMMVKQMQLAAAVGKVFLPSIGAVSLHRAVWMSTRPSHGITETVSLTVCTY